MKNTIAAISLTLAGCGVYPQPEPKPEYINVMVEQFAASLGESGPFHYSCLKSHGRTYCSVRIGDRVVNLLCGRSGCRQE